MTDSLFFLFMLLALVVVTGTAAMGAISAAPWVPLRKHEVRRMLKLAELKPGETVYDLGAGDGRILAVAAQEFGAKAVGWEIALLPYLAARIRLWRTNNAAIRFSSFFKTDFSSADVVACFLTPMAMAKLLPKLQRELKPGARFVAYAFPLPNTQEDALDKPTQRQTRIFLYRSPLKPVND